MSKRLELAREGDPTEIAHLLNHQLNPQSISVRVNRKDNCLGILVEANSVPNQPTIVQIIRQFLEELQLTTISTIKIYGRRLTQKAPVWYEELELELDIEAEESLGFGLIDWLSQGLAADGKQIVSQTFGRSTPELPTMSSGSQALSPDPLSTTQSELEEPELRYLKFLLNTQEIALLSLSSIQEVLKIPIAEVLPVPHMPACVLGIFNCRGEMLWVVDLALQLGILPEEGITNDSPFLRANLQFLNTIVVRSGKTFVGFVVSHIEDIESHSSSHLQTSHFTTLFPSHLSPFMQGYLRRSSLPILDANALMQDHSLQVHRPV
jgi:positive phototaxis protein PixI